MSNDLVYSRLLLEWLIKDIHLKLLNNQDCSKYLFDLKIPNSLYKKIVFDKNTNVNITKRSVTALMCSSAYSNILKIRILLSHPDIDVNVQDGDGYTALHHTCYHGELLILNLLLQHSSIDVNIKEVGGLTALSYTLYMGNHNYFLISKLLLAHPKIDINSIDKYKNTALMYATYNRMGDSITLLQHYSSLNRDIKNKWNLSADDYSNPEKHYPITPYVITSLEF